MFFSKIRFNRSKFLSLATIVACMLCFQNCAPSFKSRDSSGDLPSVLGGAPILTIRNKPNSIVNSTSANISYSAVASGGAQIVSIKCTFNSEASEECMQGFSRSGLADGSQTLRIVAKDSRNRFSQEEVVGWVVDTIAPSARYLLAPPDNGIVSSRNVNITFSQPTDAVGISNVSCSYGNSLATILNTPVDCRNNSMTLNNLNPGSVFVRVKVTDTAQNIFNLDKNFRVDLSLPTVSILNPRPSALSNITNFTFTFSGAFSGQALTTFECALDAEVFTACNGGSKSYSQLAEGSRTFSVRSVNPSTNTRSGEQTYQFAIDRSSPVVNITAPAAAATITTSSTTATFTVSDANLASVARVCRLDNVQLASCNNSVPLTNLTNGPHTFSVTATDGATNQTVVSRSFTVSISAATIDRILRWNPSLNADGSVDLSITNYNVYVGTAPGVYDSPISVAASPNPSVVLRGLTVGRTYYIAITAVNAVGESVHSSVFTYVAQ